MIKVTFIDGTSKRYKIGCKQLGFLSWHHIDYKPMFEPIAKIIGVDVENIKQWQVK